MADTPTTTKARRTRDGEADPYADVRDESEAAIARAMRRLLREQRRRVLDAGGEYGAAFWQAERERIAAAMQPLMVTAMLGAANARALKAVDAFGAPMGTEQDDTPMPIPVLWDEAALAAAAIAWAAAYLSTFGRRVTDTTERLVIAANGDDMMLDAAFADTRAERIGVTETTVAITAGMALVLAEMRRRGMNAERIWRTAEDERVCPICGALENKREGQGWGGLEPPAHVNCRCWIDLVRA